MMGIQAKITFTSLNDIIFPVRRVITLNPETSKITVGRASKSFSKSLQGAADNAWFDSPVMSRDHAEVSLNTETESLVIQDIGSMHGTCINDTQLPSYLPKKLHNGDIVVFGTEVKRGSDTFPPCKFIVNYEISSYKSANTFAYPESDFDDDDDISFGDSDIDQDLIVLSSIKKISHSEDNLLDKTSQPKITASLINDASLTSNNDKENNENIDYMVSETKNLIIQKVDLNAVQHPQSTAKSEIRSTCKELTICPIINDEEPNPGDPNLRPSIEPGIKTDIEKIKEIRKSNIDQHIERNATSEPPSQATDEGTWGDSTKEISQGSNVRKYCYSLDSESDNHSKYGTSPTSDEEIRALFDDELTLSNGCDTPPCDYESSRFKKGKFKKEYDSAPNASTELSLSASICSTEGFIEGFTDSSTSSDRSVFSEPENESSSTNNVYPYGDVIPFQESNSCARQYRSFNSEEPWDHVLGEKSGKVAYFRARESNKAKFHSMGHQTDDINCRFMSSGRQKLIESTMCENLEFFDELATSNLPTAIKRNNTCDEVPILSRCFSTEKSELEDKKKDVVPDSDNTKAEVFDFIKESMIDITSKSSSESKITDVTKFVTNDIEQVNCRKRKANAISIDDATEVQDSTKNPKLAAKEPSSKLLKKTTYKKKAKNSNKSTSSRPLKRRKLVENLGYIAFGGFAAAAGLFSILVATAPEFT